MQLTKREIQVGVFAVFADENNKERVLDFGDELKMASGIMKKFHACVGSDGKTFEDGDIEFSAEEKSYLSSRMQRKWQIGDGDPAISLMEKLK